MLSALILVLVVLICVGTVLFALREKRDSGLEVRMFALMIASRAHPGSSPSPAQFGRIPAYIRELFDEALQVGDPRLAAMAVSEVSGRASLVRAKGAALGRGLSRIPMLAGAAGGFSVVALGAFSRAAWGQAGASVFLGITCSVVCLSFAAVIRSDGRRYGETAESLERALQCQP
jgi:hypothetical protein